MGATRLGLGFEAATLAALLLAGALACKPKTQSKDAADVASVVAQIASNPKAIAPTTTKEAAGVARYTYPDQAGGAVSGVELTTTKEKAGAWHVSMRSASGKLGWRSFSIPRRRAMFVGQSLARSRCDHPRSLRSAWTRRPISFARFASSGFFAAAIAS